MHAASVLAPGFSVVHDACAHLRHGVASRRALRHAALLPQRARRRTVAVLDLDKPGSAARRIILDECRRALAEDGSDAIVLGCAGMAELCAEIEDALGAPVIEGVTAAVKWTEALVALRLSTAKRGDYARPLPKRYDGALESFSPSAADPNPAPPRVSHADSLRVKHQRSRAAHTFSLTRTICAGVWAHQRVFATLVQLAAGRPTCCALPCGGRCGGHLGGHLGGRRDGYRGGAAQGFNRSCSALREPTRIVTTHSSNHATRPQLSTRSRSATAANPRARATGRATRASPCSSSSTTRKAARTACCTATPAPSSSCRRSSARRATRTRHMSMEGRSTSTARARACGASCANSKSAACRSPCSAWAWRSNGIPNWRAAFIELGHEIACHGWRWIHYQNVSTRPPKREHMRLGMRGHRARHRRAAARLVHRPRQPEHAPPRGRLRRLSSTTPTTTATTCRSGWRSQVTDGATVPQLIVPYTLDTQRHALRAAAGLLACRPASSTYLKRQRSTRSTPKATRRPRCCRIGMHCRLLGRPGRIPRRCSAFSTISRQHDRVWVYTARRHRAALARTSSVSAKQPARRRHEGDAIHTGRNSTPFPPTHSSRRSPGIFEHSPWVAEIAANERPFASIDELHRKMSKIVETAGEDKQLALINAHPELAGRQRARRTHRGIHARTKRRGPLRNARRQSSTSCFALNAAYREKFGFPFILAVRGYDRHGIIANFEARVRQQPRRRTAREPRSDLPYRTFPARRPDWCVNQRMIRRAASRNVSSH